MTHRRRVGFWGSLDLAVRPDADGLSDHAGHSAIVLARSGKWHVSDLSGCVTSTDDERLIETLTTAKARLHTATSWRLGVASTPMRLSPPLRCGARRPPQREGVAVAEGGRSELAEFWADVTDAAVDGVGGLCPSVSGHDVRDHTHTTRQADGTVAATPIRLASASVPASRCRRTSPKGAHRISGQTSPTWLRLRHHVIGGL